MQTMYILGLFSVAIWCLTTIYLFKRATNHIRALTLLKFIATLALFTLGYQNEALVLAMGADILMVKILLDIRDGRLKYKGRSLSQQVREKIDKICVIVK